MKKDLKNFWDNYIISNQEYWKILGTFKLKYKILLIITSLVVCELFYFIQNNTFNLIVLLIIYWLIWGIVMGIFRKSFGNKLYKEINKKSKLI